MKKTIIILSFGLLILSCSREDEDLNIDSRTGRDIDAILIQNDRLVFQDYNEFLETYNKMTKYSDNELRLWAQSKMHSTLIDTRDSVLINYSSILRTILNKNLEFELDGFVVMLKEGEFLGYPKNDNPPDKENLQAFTKIASVSLSKIDLENSKATDLGAGQRNSIWQNEFILERYYPCGGPLEFGFYARRKFVSEIYHEAFYNSSFEQWNSNLWLRIKLEERTSKIDWRTCWNYREISYNVSGTANYMFGGYVVSSHPFSTSAAYLNCGYSGPLGVFITSASYAPNPSSPVFNVSMSGYITQHILGDQNPNNTITVPSAPPGGILW
jgi:hypothetical protein